jgi:uncharacterized membrane protein
MQIKPTFLLLSLAAILLIPAHSVQAGVQDFSISSFEADYYLSRDSERASHLKVVEKIVAEFPQFDQNHGIERAIPLKYQGHGVDLSVESVKKIGGGDWSYSTSESNNNSVLRIGDADSYVRGKQTYIITYNMRSVISKQDEQDEFYWDTNGDQWKQPLSEVKARVHLNKDIAQTFLTNKLVCYTGTKNTTTNDCGFTATNDGAGSVITFTTDRVLNSSETLTVVMGFTKDSFAAYTPSASEKAMNALMGVVVAINIAVPIVVFAVMLSKWRRVGRDPEGRGAIAPQYLPPKETGVISSGIVLKEKFMPIFITAQIIDLAVRHYIKIYETSKKVLPVQNTSYELELTKLPTDLRAEEQAAIGVLFGDSPQVGQRVKLDDLSEKLYKDAQQISKDAENQLVVNDYFKNAPSNVRRTYYIIAGVMFFVSMPVIIFAFGIALSGVIVALFGRAMPARTEKGVVLREYLFGLRDYMKLAEADRLKVLQSPHGDLTEKIDVGDSQQLVKLYEKLLPYAVLFGIEKQWAGEFAKLYRQSPDWYNSTGAFQAAYFVTAMHGFTQASASSFAPPSNSSSSGFGGGYAGGGGGGGGGGGW